MTLLLCRTVWLKYYDGRPDDMPYGNHEWVRDGGVPHECKNFVPDQNDKLLGFVQIRDWGNIKIERLGAAPDASEVSGVTVVWCAQHPDGRGIVITGWYKDATIFRVKQPSPDDWGVTWGDSDGEWAHRIEARRTKGHLVDYLNRDYLLQRKGEQKDQMLFGMADLCYVSERRPALAAKILEYVEQKEAANSKASRRVALFSGEPDPERNARVEAAAMAFVESHYHAWSVDDVSKKDRGWDLEVKKGTKTLFVEVKGRSVASPAFVVLTRNERQHFELAAADRAWANKYRLAVVYDALGNPTLRIYRYQPHQGWRCELTSEGIDVEPVGLLIQPR